MRLGRRASYLVERRRRWSRAPHGEWLERRTLLASTPLDRAVPLQFGAFNDADASHFLAEGNEFDLYSVTLQKGDTIVASVSAQQSGSGLASLLRVFDVAGTPLAIDNQEGGDPHLNFQAASTGQYYLGVSSAPDNSYNPTVNNSGVPGATIGLYQLDVQRLTSTPLLSDLTGSSFRTGAQMAAPGDVIPVSFSVENRGGADPGNFQVQVLLAQNNLFGPSSRILATLPRAQLVAGANGRDFASPSDFSVTIPAGRPDGPAFLGIRIVTDRLIFDSGAGDKSGVHRGLDWAPLTVVTRVLPGVTDLSQADPGLYSEVNGILGAGQTGTWTFVVSSALGNGEFKAEVATTSGSLRPRLSLSGSTGQLLIQSDGGEIVQYLEPGAYILTVAQTAGAGGYRLSTQFANTTAPFVALPGGAGTAWVAQGDLNGDGVPDVVVANRIDDTVSVYLGTGDGTFYPPTTDAIGQRVWRVTVADVNGDGKLDILTANKGDNTISILLGNGDGTFQPQAVFPVGTRPGGVAVADVNGDGFPDVIVSNYADSTIGVMLNQGNDTFSTPRLYSTTVESEFAGTGPPVIADVNGDGVPDLLYPDYEGANVGVRLGLGDGAFGAQRVFPAGVGAYSLSAVDANGDGKLDLVVANAVDNTVSVLLGNGNGTFQAQKVFPVGFDPFALVTADLNNDGIPDFVTANRGDNTESVLLGNGDGTLKPYEVVPTGNTARGIAVADFNGDGKVDFVNANLGDNTATVLLGNGDGTVSTGAHQVVPASNLRPFQEVVADVNGDGIPDIITANRSDNSVSVLLGNRDGSFQTRETFATGRLPISVAVADLNGDGKPDIVTANYTGSNVSVLFGNGDGTFQTHVDLPAGNACYDVKVADLNGDGIPDLVVTNKDDNTVGVFLGEGKGAFKPMAAFPVASGPYEVVIEDLTGNGIPDLVVSHFSYTGVDVLFGNGDGTFQPTREFPVGSRPYGLAVADLNGDGLPDIVTSDYRDNEISVLLNEDNGDFGPPQLYPVGKGPNEVQVADVNGDGRPDLVSANYGSGTVSVLLGNGDGNFAPQRTFPAGSGPASVAIADLNGDGKLDLVTGNRNASSVTVLHGNGDGTFLAPIQFGLGENRYALAVADLNGDGNPDVVATHLLQNSLTVLLGNGTGTFEPGQIVSLGAAPSSVTAADLNGDGRVDLVITSASGNSVSVLLGNGDGTFSVQQTVATGRSPRRVAVADLNGDGILDLAVTNYNDGTVSVLLGNGDGTFRAQDAYPVGERPYSLSIADLNGDGKPDIVVANSADDTISVLLGNGDGSFGQEHTFATGREPFSVAVADLNGDGIPDIIAANSFDDTVSVLRGNADGTFQSAMTFAVGSRPYSIAVADVNGDGKPDIVTSDYGADSVSVLLNDGSGLFRLEPEFSSDRFPVATAVADVNKDGRPDLVTVSNFDSATGVLLGLGDGSFQAVTATSGVGVSDTPLLADFSGDGIADSVVLDRSGNILLRRGLPGAAGSFAPPVILNPGRPARDITVLPIGSQFAIAAADARNDPTLSSTQFIFTVSIYSVSADGRVSRRTAFSTKALPTSLFAADLTGNKMADLIATNALDNDVSIAMQAAPGNFALPITVPTGMTPSDVTVADENGDGLPDIVVSDQASGDLAVLLNDPAHSFSNSLRFRASTSLYGLDTTSGGAAVSSFAQSVSLAAGDFLGTGQSDIAVINQATHSFIILAADGSGGFANPSQSLTTSTSDGSSINARPGAMVAGDFNRDGRLDLAVLMEDTGALWIYSGNGDGTFRHTFSIPVGDLATGLTVVPAGGSGLLNLLVGNGFGDVLALEGKGDGTFQIVGNRVSLSVVPNLLGPGQAGVLVGNQQDNRVTVQAPSASGSQYTPVQTLGSSSSSEQMAPGDVEWAVLDRGATLPDAVVVSTGSNAVVVYRTTGVNGGVPSFAQGPHTYFVGTAPASLTVADLNGDHIPDMLIADQGSNDISVIFGSYDSNGDWLGIAGPRLKSGGDGPIAVTVRELNGDAVSDLAVVNGGSGTVTLLRGVGRGFFDDQDPKTLFNLGSAVVQAPTFVGDGTAGYEVTAAGDLVRFDLSDIAAGPTVVYSDPQLVAAQALPGGQVVVALSSGIVNILAPEGNGLFVQSELLAKGETPALPSAIQLVAKANGNYDVLVSSQGSDTLSVYSLAGATAGVPVTPPAGGVSLPSLNSFQPASAASGAQFVILTTATTATSGSATSASTSSSASSSSGALSATATSAIGLSLGGFSSLGNRSTNDSGEALLVSVEGNTYLSVPILNFGSDQGDEPGVGEGRMPWLQGQHAFGDTSPLTRFVIGLDEALRDYRGSEDELLRGNSGRSRDPWNEDLFYRRLPAQPPILRQENDEPKNGGGSEAALAEPNQIRLAKDAGSLSRIVDERPDEPGVLDSSPADRFVAGLKRLVGLVASLVLVPALFRYVSRPPPRSIDLEAAKARRVGA
jgi:FG-GAP-like repeat/Bacterial pre-peptidase C-terminal domain